MDYTVLTEKDKEALRQQRIGQLEADHYRLELVLLETTDNDRCAQLLTQQAALEAAIAVHTGVPAAQEAAAHSP